MFASVTGWSRQQEDGSCLRTRPDFFEIPSVAARLKCVSSIALALQGPHSLAMPMSAQVAEVHWVPLVTRKQRNGATLVTAFAGGLSMACPAEGGRQ